MKLTVIGCGNASGSGGRYFTSFYVETGKLKFLIDCGATTLNSLKKHNIQYKNIDAILITHFHGDHFGGIPFYVIDVRLDPERTKPLHITGPTGVREKVFSVMELLFPGSSTAQSKFELVFYEYNIDEELILLEELKIIPFKVKHSEKTLPHALRIKTGDKIIAYSGDTEWTDELLKASERADLFICECSNYKEKVEGHLDYYTLKSKIPKITAKRIILTHFGDDMLKVEDKLDSEYLTDGMEIEL